MLECLAGSSPLRSEQPMPSHGAPCFYYSSLLSWHQGQEVMMSEEGQGNQEAAKACQQRGKKNGAKTQKAAEASSYSASEGRGHPR